MSAQNADTNGKIVISLFAGCGGSSLGYKQAGFKELLAIDFEKNAVNTFRLNFPETPIWQRDIRSVHSSEILEFCQIKKGELDVLDGSPPCQGFSSAGKRNINDSRNDLFKEYVRIVKELEPKVFLMENVSGMVKGQMKGRFIEIFNELKKLNYNVKCSQLNSMFYEVPQNRKRLIFIGIRKDLNIIPTFPKMINNIIKVSDIYPTHIKMNREQFDRKWTDTNRPAYTIVKRVGLKFKLIDGTIRRATIEEIKRLSSFPEDFQLTGNFGVQWAQVGNAVMPRFMYHLAKHIKEISSQSS